MKDNIAPLESRRHRRRVSDVALHQLHLSAADPRGFAPGVHKHPYLRLLLESQPLCQPAADEAGAAGHQNPPPLVSYHVNPAIGACSGSGRARLAA